MSITIQVKTRLITSPHPRRMVKRRICARRIFTRLSAGLRHTYQIATETRFIAFLLILIFGACQEAPDVPASRVKIFADFFVRYLSAEQQLKGQVSFRRGVDQSSAQPWQPDGEILFDLQAMQRDILPDNRVRFSHTRYKEYAEPFIFHFKGLQGKYLQYEVKMSPIQDFFAQGPITKASGATFVVHGGVLSAEEQLIFVFVDSINESRAITITGPTKDIEIKLNPEQVASLTPGSGRLYLIKKRLKEEIHPNIEIRAEVECYTTAKNIVVEI